MSRPASRIFDATRCRFTSWFAIILAEFDQIAAELMPTVQSGSLNSVGGGEIPIADNVVKVRNRSRSSSGSDSSQAR